MKHFYLNHILLCLFLLLGTNVFAYDAKIDGIYYNFSGEEAEVTFMDENYQSYSGSVNIPSSVRYNDKTYRVTSIGDYAFYNCYELIAVIIPESVTNIGDYAFYYSALTSVTIPESVNTIGDYAFDYCYELTSVTLESDAIVSATRIEGTSMKNIFGGQVKTYIIGNAVKGIGDYAFYGCDVMTSVTIPESVTTIGESAFAYCSSLTSVTIPESVTSISDYAFNNCVNMTDITIGSGLTAIGNGTFYGCSSLTSVTIPNSVTSIGDYAFYYSALTSVTIPESVNTIGDYAFDYCYELTSVTLESDAIVSATRTYDTSMRYIFGSQVKTYVIGNAVKGIGDYAFYGCDVMTSVTIPESVTTIGESAFAYCSSLTSVTIPESVTSISDYAFNNCVNMSDITIGSGVTAIGNSSFYGCSSLTSVTIPNSVTSIGDYAFYYSALTSVTIPESVNTIGDYAFDYCYELTSVTLESDAIVSATRTYDTSIRYIFGGQVKTYVIGNAVKGIGDFAFYDCNELTSFTIPESVTSIGESAFAYCSSLTSVTIPESVTRIGDYAFQGCTDMTDITIGSGVTAIGNGTFSSCPNLTSVTIPNSVTRIGDYAFQYCSALTSVTIPESVKAIGDYAFDYCYELTSVTLESDAIVSATRTYDTSMRYIFGGQVKTYVIGNAVKGIGDYAFYDCNELTSVTIGSGVMSIGESAFEYCSNLTSVTLESSAIVSAPRTSETSMSSIFGPQVKTYVIGDAVKGIGENAFYACSDMTSVTIGRGVTSIGESAFADCSGLTSVHITDLIPWLKIKFHNPNSNPLYNAHHLYLNGNEVTKVVIPDDITSIDNYTFIGCSDLTSVIIGSGVMNIGTQSFDQCPISLLKTEIASPVDIYEGTFSNRFNAILSVPRGSKTSYQAANYWQQFKKIIENGDVNADEENDVVDVVDIARFTVGTPSESFIEFFADINKDGTVNLGDAVVLVNDIAGDQNFVKEWKAQRRLTSNDMLSLTEHDGNLSMNLDNERYYTAFQFDLYVPENIEVSQMMLNAERKQGHQLLYNKVEDGHYRVAALSTSNHTFDGDNGELLNLTLNGISDNEVYIRDIHFFDTMGNDYLFENMETAITTGVRQIDNEQWTNDNNAIYDMQGRKLDKMQHGINIVNGKKVLY